MNKRLLLRFSLREAMGLVFMAIVLFWSAGRIDWWAAWALIGVTAAWVVGTAVAITRHHPDLLAERLGPRKGAKKWDTAIMSIYGLLTLAVLLVAGLDQRYGWSAGFSLALQYAALVACILGYAVVVWATDANAYFSQIVRIQTERSHSVATGGPYRFIRHPGYAGSIVTALAVPVLLDSSAALVLGFANMVLLVLRTTLEDRTLHEELPGYADYANQTRYRLVPGVW